MTKHEPELATVDLRAKIEALNPRYLSAPPLADRHDGRINDLAYTRADGRLYLILADAYLFYSEDGLQTLCEVEEVNYWRGELIARNQQSVDAVVDTMHDTILVVGRDRRPDRDDADGELRAVEVGVVWRKERGAHTFTRVVAADPYWASSKNCNLAAGYFGREHLPMAVLTIYEMRDAHFYFSLDDGLSWRRHPMSEYFLHHTHEAYLPRSVNNSRTARLWMTGGDDPSGQRSGLLCFDRLQEDGTITPPRWVFRERPGFRLVGLKGNGRHIFVGNESIAGGMLKLQDNEESIAAADFESVLGKSRHDYHQFRAQVAGWDGVLAAGTDSYGHTGDTVRADSGGYLYISNDEGATFAEIPLGARWTTAMAYDGTYFWCALSGSRETGPDVSEMRYTVVRLRKPSPYEVLAAPLVSRVLAADSSEFYRMAGFPTHPEAVLETGQATARCDFAAYRSLALMVDAREAGTLAIEATPFYTWRLEEVPWAEVQRVKWRKAEHALVPIGNGGHYNRYYRVRNVGRTPLRLRWLALIGRR